jgi:hypothetical protein
MQICGRYFSQAEIDWIRRQAVESPAGLTRAELSRMFCRKTGWRKPDGGLKEMSCRVAMLRLHRCGLIRLPEPKKTHFAKGGIKRTADGEVKNPIDIDASRADIVIEPVDRKTASLWNELIDRYHYLGFSRTGGAQMRFFVKAGEHLAALLGFSAAAWRVAARDDFIGWTDAQRKANLHRVVDNSRFLILPWVRSKNLASRILSRVARTLPDFWQRRYRYRPVLLESFVEKQRFSATCYKAANWTCVGQTQGRGKWDRKYACDKPVKTIWLYPLDRRFKEALCR